MESESGKKRSVEEIGNVEHRTLFGQCCAGSPYPGDSDSSSVSRVGKAKLLDGTPSQKEHFHPVSGKVNGTLGSSSTRDRSRQGGLQDGGCHNVPLAGSSNGSVNTDTFSRDLNMILGLGLRMPEHLKRSSSSHAPTLSGISSRDASGSSPTDAEPLSQKIGAIVDTERDRIVQILRAFMLAKHIKTDSRPCEIEKGLYLGSVGAAHNKALLQEFGVSRILTVANSLPPMYPQDFKYTVIDVLDSPEVDLVSRFEECFEVIRAAHHEQRGTLVHCFAGRSRSVTVVLAYLMKVRKMRVDAALKFVKEKRPEACPNAGFMEQLRKYEKMLQEDGTLEEDGTVEEEGPLGAP